MQWHIFCQRVGLVMGRLLVGATDFWPTMSGISSDGKEVKDTFRCLAEITLNTMLNILLMLEYLGVLHLSNLIQLYILSTPNGGVSLTNILHLTEYEEILFIYTTAILKWKRGYERKHVIGRNKPLQQRSWVFHLYCISRVKNIITN